MNSLSHSKHHMTSEDLEKSAQITHTLLSGTFLSFFEHHRRKNVLLFGKTWGGVKRRPNKLSKSGLDTNVKKTMQMSILVHCRDFWLLYKTVLSLYQICRVKNCSQVCSISLCSAGRSSRNQIFILVQHSLIQCQIWVRS